MSSSSSPTPILQRIPLIQRILLFKIKSPWYMKLLSRVCSAWEETILCYGTKDFLHSAINNSISQPKVTEARALFIILSKSSSASLSTAVLEMIYEKDDSTIILPKGGNSQQKKNHILMSKFVNEDGSTKYELPYVWQNDSRKSNLFACQIHRRNILFLKFGHLSVSVFFAVLQNPNQQRLRDENMCLLLKFVEASFLQNVSVMEVADIKKMMNMNSGCEGDDINALRQIAARDLLLRCIIAHTTIPWRNDGMHLLAYAVIQNNIELVSLIMNSKYMREGGALEEAGGHAACKHFREIIHLQALRYSIECNKFAAFKLLTSTPTAPGSRVQEELLVDDETWIGRCQSKFRDGSVRYTDGLNQKVNQIFKDNWIHMLFEYGRLEFIQHLLSVSSSTSETFGQRLFTDPSRVNFSLHKLTPLAKVLSSTKMDQAAKLRMVNFILNDLLTKKKQNLTQMPFRAMLDHSEFDNKIRLRAHGRENPIHYCARHNYDEILRVLLKPGNLTLLFNLPSLTDYQKDEKAILHKVLYQPNSKGYTPLMLCASNGSVEVAKILIEKARNYDENEIVLLSSAVCRWRQLNAIQIAIFKGQEESPRCQEVKNLIVDACLVKHPQYQKLLVAHQQKKTKNDNNKKNDDEESGNDDTGYKNAIEKLRNELSKPPLRDTYRVGHRKYPGSLLTKFVADDRDFVATRELLTTYSDHGLKLLNPAFDTEAGNFFRESVLFSIVRLRPENTKDAGRCGQLRIDLLELVLKKEESVRGRESMTGLVNLKSKVLGTTVLHTAVGLGKDIKESVSLLFRLIEILVHAGANRDVKDTQGKTPWQVIEQIMKWSPRRNPLKVYMNKYEALLKQGGTGEISLHKNK